MDELVSIDRSIRLDQHVERKGESHLHWAIKAAIIDLIRSDPDFQGKIEDEKKTGELIADIRCVLSESPSDVPNRLVVEVQTNNSDKEVVDATRRHLRFGYAVYWVYDVDAAQKRRAAEAELSEYMSTRPSLGVASLPDGELSLGEPVTWNEFDMESPKMARNEFYVPTYDRKAPCFDHGTFQKEGHQFTIYSFLDEESLYVSWHGADDQRSLPKVPEWSWPELNRYFQEGKIKRISPVGGPP